MRRRDFMALLGGAAAWPLLARAQQPKLPRIGVLIPSNPEPFWTEFRAGLREHGYTEDQNIAFEFRSADGKPNLLRELAAELVRLKVDIIVASQTPAVTAARHATTEIPIIMAVAGDPERSLPIYRWCRRPSSSSSSTRKRPRLSASRCPTRSNCSPAR
jgi:putative ABC transport system substrate-binding protein